MNITKRDFINLIASETMLSKETVNLVLTAFVEKVPMHLKAGNSVTLRGLGSFSVTEHKGTIGQDIRKGKAVVIPAHKRIKFKSYIEL